MRLIAVSISTILICGLFILSGMSFIPPQVNEGISSERIEYENENLSNLKLYYNEDCLENNNPISKH